MRINHLIHGENCRIAEEAAGRVVENWLCAGHLPSVAELDSANEIIAVFANSYMENNETLRTR